MTASVQGVGNRIARLTPGNDGLTTGAFTEQTVPTVSQVAAVLADAVGDISSRFGPLGGDDDGQLQEAADSAAEWTAAADIAMSWNPTNFELIDRLRTRAADALAALTAGFIRLHPGEIVDPGNGGGGGGDNEDRPPATSRFFYPPALEDALPCWW